MEDFSKPGPVIYASYTGTSLILSAPLLTWLLANGPGKAGEDNGSAWVSVSHVGDTGEVLGSGFCLVQA